MSKIRMKGRTRLMGVGINDSLEPIATKVEGKKQLSVYYERWASLLRKCYSENSRFTMAEEWHRFSVFREWMQTQDWEGKYIVPTKEYPGCTHFSKETAIFVPREIKDIVFPPGRFRNLPVGTHPVSKNRSNSYKCIFTFRKQRYYKGTFNNIAEAHATCVYSYLDLIKEKCPELITPEMQKMMVNTVHPEWAKPEY